LEWIITASKQTKTEIMLTVGDPGQAFKLSLLPNSGVGLARTEFIINNHIGIHPMALAHYPKLKDQEAIKKIAERIGLQSNLNMPWWFGPVAILNLSGVFPRL
jgi:phosphoenolpyruvate synthase/pyruvate phosphate dikinase